MAPAETLTVFLKLLAAGFYGVSSFLIVVVNKSVLTNYRWPGWRAATEARRAGGDGGSSPAGDALGRAPPPRRRAGSGDTARSVSKDGRPARLTVWGPARPHAHAPAVATVTRTPGQKFVCVCVFP